MKKIIMSVLCSLIGHYCSYGQPQQLGGTKQFITIGNKPAKYTNLGVNLKTGTVKEEDTPYADTVMVNAYFRELAKTTDPTNVVLVVQMSPLPGHPGHIFTHDSPWLTATMRQLGFNKWIPADPREVTPEYNREYAQQLHHLTDFMNTHYDMRLDNSPDMNAIPQSVTRCIDSNISPGLRDSVIADLSKVADGERFIDFVRSQCEFVIKKGYKPLIIIGRYNVLSMEEHCTVESVSYVEDDEQHMEIMRTISIAQARRFVLDDFRRKYDPPSLRKK